MQPHVPSWFNIACKHSRTRFPTSTFVNLLSNVFHRKQFYCSKSTLRAMNNPCCRDWRRCWSLERLHPFIRLFFMILSISLPFPEERSSNIIVFTGAKYHRRTQAPESCSNHRISERLRVSLSQVQRKLQWILVQRCPFFHFGGLPLQHSPPIRWGAQLWERVRRGR